MSGDQRLARSTIYFVKIKAKKIQIWTAKRQKDTSMQPHKNLGLQLLSVDNSWYQKSFSLAPRVKLSKNCKIWRDVTSTERRRNGGEMTLDIQQQWFVRRSILIQFITLNFRFRCVLSSIPIHCSIIPSLVHIRTRGITVKIVWCQPSASIVGSGGKHLEDWYHSQNIHKCYLLLQV